MASTHNKNNNYYYYLVSNSESDDESKENFFEGQVDNEIKVTPRAMP